MHNRIDNESVPYSFPGVDTKRINKHTDSVISSNAAFFYYNVNSIVLNIFFMK